MRIAYITGGSAGMYCGTCMHDNTLASSLIDKGHEVSLLPTYTPLRLDEESVADERIFFGAVNVYLQQKLAFFRKHKALDRLLDSRRVLGLISKLGVSSTNADDLGALTLSMMQGEAGYQDRELDKLVDFLAEIVEPEIVHLSFTLFAGFAKRIKDRLGVPVVCSLQGEDLFYDDLTEPWRQRTLDELQVRLGDIDLFTAHCDYYADLMSERFGVPRERTVTTRLGIRPDGFYDTASDRKSDLVTVGYLARQCPEKGLHLLVDAFCRVAPDHPELQLRVAGFVGGKDEAFVAEQHRNVEAAGLGDRVLWRRDVTREEKVRFLADLDIFSVPAVYKEPKGLYVPEALAAGSPVLLPAHGAFPEWIERTGGGVLVDPADADALADGLRQLAGDRDLRRRLGLQGRAAIEQDFNHDVMAEEMLGVYRRVLGGRVAEEMSRLTRSAGEPAAGEPVLEESAA